MTPTLTDVARALWATDGRARAVLIADGVGAHVLSGSRAAAPALYAAWVRAGTPTARCGFPSTTAAAIPTIGRAQDCLEHGLVGHAFRGEDGELVWPTHMAPGAAQALAGVPARRAAALIAGPSVAASGLSEEAFPGARVIAADGDAFVDRTAEAVNAGELAFCYFGDADATAHRHGLGSREHLAALSALDALFTRLSAAVGAKRLVVLADHGMCTVGAHLRLADHLDADDVEMIGGESRAVYLYARPGRASRLLARARRIPGVAALSRDDAISTGLLAGRADAAARARVGDVVLAATAAISLTWRGGPRGQHARAQHGGVTDAERYVPVLGL
jgi:hypothetical protein